MSECLTPYRVLVDDKYEDVPCGKCPACAKRRASAWSFRLMEHEKISDSSYFITLTYDTDHVPITDNGFMGLRKRDLQLFYKRLRKAMPAGSKPIKYYSVGEYGGRSKRPHYHAIIFNAKLPLIQPAWQLGQVDYGTVTGASIGYVLKYISKKSQIPMHRNDDRQKEFALMSKCLGANYITDAMSKWHKDDLENRMYCNLKDGQKISMPRYFKNKIYSEEERKLVGEATRKRMQADLEKEMENPNYFKDKEEYKIYAFKKQQKDARQGEQI